MARLTSLFSSRDYCLMQRQKLRSITQNADETDLKFVKRVIAAAKLCNFGEEQLLENVVFIIQSSAVNIKVREASRKVLRKGGNLTSLLDKIQACEMEKLNEEMYRKNHRKTNNAEVAAVSYSHKTETGSQVKGYGSSYHSRPFIRKWDLSQQKGQHFRQSVKYENRNPCTRCTSTRHLTSECHAIDKICRKCHRKGHLERACGIIPASTHNTMKRKNDDQQQGPPPKVRQIAAVSQTDLHVDEPVEANHAINISKKDCNCVIVGYIANCAISFLIDSGAEVNTIDSNTFNLLKNATCHPDLFTV
ncbi:uncharacterized protein LOC134209670 [Armigeres subalbatus]|uniref:uncharacterized protein LOC134209670 n=2 Tax=Armigeres subalbatus TaxID=124917 RepID=UPI002ED33B97